MMDRPQTKPTSLEEIAMVSMEFGRLLMESGASARFVDEIVDAVARGLGAERVDLRIGYASLAVTVGIGSEGITRMREVGRLGVNQRLAHSLRELANTVQRRQLTPAAARSSLHDLLRASPRYPGWLVDIAVGVACASFGRLLRVDWAALAPIVLSAAIGQWFRRLLAAHQMNVFIAAASVAFIASALAGVGARLFGSLAIDTAMIASVLLLVPGVPSLNAQNDILEGHPTLGSARAVWVLMMLVFLTVGIWVSRVLLAQWGIAGMDRAHEAAVLGGWPQLLHQILFGGLAAVGFGVLFNMSADTLLWCGVSGALALAVRFSGLELGWSSVGASFAAALVVGAAVRLFQKEIGVSRNTLAVAGCIPMIPGGLAAKAILGLMALTQPALQNGEQTLMSSVQDSLRVLFTIGAMGTGLAIPSMLLRVRRPYSG